MPRDGYAAGVVVGRKMDPTRQAASSQSPRCRHPLQGSTDASTIRTRAANECLADWDRTKDAVRMAPSARRRRPAAPRAFWTRQASNTLDRATAMMPRLLYERLDEFGCDYAIIYPTAGLRMPRISDDATRRAVIRAHNIVTADYFRKLSDRMTPAAIIPMHHPDEAVEELEFVTKQLGSKVGMFGSGMSRRVPSTPQSDPDGNRLAVYYDVLAIDSEYDYKTVWEKCEELGIAPTLHSSGRNQGLRKLGAMPSS